MDYVIAILQVSGIVILCYLFVMFGISGKLKNFLSDSWGIIMWIIGMKKFIKKDEKTETVVGKEHEKRMKKYRKIWKEKGCIHWKDSSD